MQRAAIKIAGPAGTGIKSIGQLIQKTLQRLGFYTFGYTEYPSLIRGGHNTFQIDYSDEEINSSSETIQILLALDYKSINLHEKELEEKGVLICDKTILTEEFNVENKKYKLIDLPIKEMLESQKIPLIMQNMVQVGVIMAICDYPIEILYSVIQSTFSDKSEEIIEGNKFAAQTGYKLVEGTTYDTKVGIELKNNSTPKNTLVLTSNESCALGFISGGGKFYSAYPMTPATNLLHYLSKYGPSKGIIVRQASNEIEAIGIALGASYAGVRAMTGTSGGGYDLMTEFISMAGIAEIPIVIVNSQRTGPATGLPTWQEQSDLNLVKYSSHGEFPRVVIAPGDPKEAYELTIQALDIAEEYQIPVIVLTDKHMSESFYTIEDLNTNIKIERKNILEEKNTPKDRNFKRYNCQTENGVSTRVLPGNKYGIHVTSSDEHNEIGYSTEDGDIRKNQQEKRMKKLSALLKVLPKPEVYGPKNSKNLIVGWGSTRGVILDVLKRLNEDQKNVAYLQLKYLYPLDHQYLQSILSKYERILLVENNSTGQLMNDLELSGKKPNELIAKFDGKPFFYEELYNIIYSKL